MNPDFIQLAQQLKRKIVLPESEDDRILEAAVYSDQNDIANITLLGNPQAIKQKAHKRQLDLGNIKIVNTNSGESYQIVIESLCELRSKQGLTKKQAGDICKQPLYFANLMVKAELVDACVAGMQTPTADVIRTALQIIGTQSKKTRLSSFFIMLLNPPLPSPLIFADCAIRISPNSKQLADIAYQSAQNAKTLLGLEPKVALLSFSSNGSAKHKSVDKVRDAVSQLNSQHPELSVIGDIQFDAALSNEVLQQKWADTHFQAPANVFVFPSLEAGNIGYKIAERIGGAIAIGPILQGLAKPVNDLSRGADVKAIINTIAVTCLQV